MDILKDGIANIISFGNKSKPNKNNLNISYGVDKNFLFGAAISMQSISLNNEGLSLNFHLFTDYMDNDYTNRIQAFCNNNPNVAVTIYIVSKQFINIFPGSKQWSYATFFRFIAFEYLANDCDNLLYIDADVICKGSIHELLTINFEDDQFAAVVKDNLFMQGKPAERLNVPGLPGNYFNAGFIYLNLRQWREHCFMQQAISMLASDVKHTKYKCLDQDILNILFFGHCLFLSDDYDKLFGVDYELDYQSDTEYKNIISEESRLIHYVGITKPWHNWTNYPSERYFNIAYEASAWSDIPLLPAVGESQFKAKYLHDKKNKKVFSSWVYFFRYRIAKRCRKIKSMFIIR